MRPIALALSAVLLAPTLGAATEPVPAVPPEAAPAAAPAATPAAAPAATPASAPSTAAAPAPAAPKEPEYSSYLVLKGGWFGSSGDFQGESFSGNGTWEIAAGTGRALGFEVASGSMTTKAAGLEVRTIPLLLSLRLAIPVSVVAPFAELGAGVYFNKATLADRSTDDVTLGWHAGLGCDVHLGRLLLGAQARYMGISPTMGAIGTLTLDRYELLLRGGVRF